MTKNRRGFFCQQCGYETAKWAGRCPSCQEWNTLVEELVVPASRTNRREKGASRPVALDDIDGSVLSRYLTGSSEMDRVLGGGLVPGSLVLLGGDPGIGKSTMMLQVAHHLSRTYGTVLYVSGEESIFQIKMRSERLGLSSEKLLILGESNLEAVEAQIKMLKPLLVVIDSIQTSYRPEIPMSPGSLGQVRESTAFLAQAARDHHTAIWLVGHVTKEGSLAGPRMLEHMVDVVLYFEGDKQYSFRLLRGSKNRFGSTNETGMFDMTEQGMIDIANPSEWLLLERPNSAVGSVVIPVMEGSRPVLIEVQALVASAGFGQPRRSVTGADYNRVSLILAVLEKKVGLMIGSHDVFVNIVGGVRTSEPAADLGIAAALVSSFRNVAVADKLVMLGEIGLTGEVRSVNQIGPRLREASRLGYTNSVIPRGNLKNLESSHQDKTTGVVRLEEALEAVLGGCF
ncbi:MAG: DNA repair protein RadA [Firmicutes bacterium]|nr:DNA repair protein RadA [Bacillota bacterium]